jgi:transposase
LLVDDSTAKDPDQAGKQPELKVSAYEPNVIVLREFIEKMIREKSFKALVTAIVALVSRMLAINTELMKRLAHLNRARPKSETLKRVESQLSFQFFGGTPAAKPEPQSEERTGARRGKRGTGRPKFDPSLPRVAERNLVPPKERECRECRSEMKHMCFEVTEVLEIEPARLYVIRRLTEVCACRHDDCIVRAPPPNEIVTRGVLGPTLIMETVANKYIAHLPVERQAVALKLAGATVSPGTLGRAVAGGIDFLEPIAKLISERTRSSSMLATDSTGLPVLDRDARDGIRTGTMWCWIGSKKWVSFFYRPKGDAVSAEAFLGNNVCGRAPTVQCDGTSILNCIERAGGKRPGCWSHGRRGLVNAARSGEVDALHGLKLIRRLFAIERLSQIKHDGKDQRLARRQAHSAPVLDELAAWIKDMRKTALPKSEFGKALRYLERQWPRLTLFLQDGEIELTNNRVERELRRLVLGRKNWLFVWQDVGGARTASILTIIGTCVAQGVNPRAYLHRVTKLLLNDWPQSKLAELLPENLARAHPELLVARPKSRSQTAQALPAAA